MKTCICYRCKQPFENKDLWLVAVPIISHWNNTDPNSFVIAKDDKHYYVTACDEHKEDGEVNIGEWMEEVEGQIKEKLNEILANKL